MRTRARLIVLTCLSSCALGAHALAAQATTEGPAAARAQGDEPAFSEEELEQMLAPIALYPDDLVSQILMASTYPLEIVQADRWVKAHESLKGDAAAKALESESWDPSVKSLVNFPDVLGLLSEKLDWTQDLGDAFIGQQEGVMNTIQKLRAKAKDAGNLDSDKNQNVEVEQAGSTQVITIESASPDVVYVPVYDPVVVYGTWPYPAYPPYPYYPPAYGAGVGIAVGFAWGYAWGHCNWNDTDIDIDIDRNIDIDNTHIDRDKYKGNSDKGRGSWQHDPSHRQGVPYRDQAASQRFGGHTSSEAARARESFRGHQGTTGLGTSGSPSREASHSTRNTEPADRRDTDGRSSSSSRSSALDGVDRGGQSARSSSSRGRSSRGGGGGGAAAAAAAGDDPNPVRKRPFGAGEPSPCRTKQPGTRPCAAPLRPSLLAPWACAPRAAPRLPKPRATRTRSARPRPRSMRWSARCERRTMLAWSRSSAPTAGT